MNKEKRILFGIDASDFARQALSETGRLLRHSENIKMKIFHCAAEPDFSIFPESMGEDPNAYEKYRKHWGLQAQRVLEQARRDLNKSGLDPDSISIQLDHKCNNPTNSLLKMADREGIDTIAVARWGKATVSRQVMGSVTYRLAQLANHKALWIIDPRICSHNVLVCLVGAPIGQRVVEHTVRYFSHLKQSKFTLLHVMPPIPPQYWDPEAYSYLEQHETQEKMALWLKDYNDKVVDMTDDAKKRLVKAGIPEQNLVCKFEPQKIGIARDILVEMQTGDHGILVIGRKGYKAIKEFGLGSKANKLLVHGRAFVICLVN